MATSDLSAKRGKVSIRREQNGTCSSFAGRGEVRPKANKYHAEKSGGYASRKEHRRANELRLMQRAGLVSDLREQVSYELIPAQYDAKGKLIERSCAYVADFVYIDEKGNTVVEDTKGMRTDVYRIKRKLMLRIHGIRITER